ncbi:MAG TPA: GGDEF domain-containing response regulator, partial [Nitrosomonas halophila]|nr:GGDEF domain-containing response regulator [Nitrosomonas halophila]
MPYSNLKLLIIDHSEADVNRLREDLTRNGKQLLYKHVDSLAGFQSALNESSWDAIVSEYSMA